MFRISIRELLLFTLAVGFGIAWWLEHRRLGALRRQYDLVTVDTYLKDDIFASSANGPRVRLADIPPAYLMGSVQVVSDFRLDVKFTDTPSRSNVSPQVGQE